MAKTSRTENSARNTTVAVFSRVVAIILGYVARIVFTHTLSQDYVGINGLFSDILNVLALSELGVGTAITYALYKPIAEENIEKQKSLMRVFKKFYMLVALVVFCLGLSIIPFMDLLIKNQPEVDYLIFIYILYLLNSVVSYLGIYKRTLIDAHQLSYISVLIQTIGWTVQNGLQIAILLTTRNYILYLLVWLLCTILSNITITIKANRMYPYLKDRNVTPLSKEEKKDLSTNIKSMLMHKIGGVVVNNTDNLLLSALIGTIAVGIYSNYYLIIGSVVQIMNQVFQGMMASVGNMGATESKERVKKIFEAIFFFGQWAYGLVTICLFEMLDSFIGLSFGGKYVFPKYITFVLCLNFYFTGMRQPTLIFRDSMGLFKYDKYKAIAEAVINIIVSLILGYYFGVVGVFIGTITSTLLTSFWVEPLVLYKKRLESKVRFYYLKYIMYTGITFVLWFAQDYVLRLFTGEGLLWAILRTAIVFVVTNSVYWLIYHKSRHYILLKDKAITLIKRKLAK